MNFIFAQLPAVSGADLSTWLVCLAAALHIAGKVKEFLPKQRQPAIEAEFATKAEVARLEAKFERGIEQVKGKIEEMRVEVNAAGERRGTAINDSLSEVNARLARVEERTKKL